MATDVALVNAPSVGIIQLFPLVHDCAMCGSVGFHKHAVPWYCGPVGTGQSDGGYKVVCEKCHDKWSEWDDKQDAAQRGEVEG